MPSAAFGTVEIVVFGVVFAWLAYAGYRLWTGTFSQTARWLGVGFAALAALGLAQDLFDLNRQSVKAGVVSADTGVVRGVVEVSGGGLCIECNRSLDGGKYRLRGNWAAGEYTLLPQGTQPFALSFRTGTARLDGAELGSGCVSGQISSESRLELNGVGSLVLEIGPGTACPN
ncbi:hypothetical protein [uncultured Meiothermus sp.]|jgi:hypothetical protein|uniref:hypothetical protein n=1 Tax=uncultured Meiothermus sp. TaxID=157471 RepID=UPI002601BBCF|nr:hypothetical protein [uncultured Meiothermus sp.]